MCSRVCGIGPTEKKMGLYVNANEQNVPSAAETTRIDPSIIAAPVIMFFT